MAVETNVKTVPVQQDDRADLQGSWKKYAKPAAIVIAAAILAISGWFAYNTWIVQPKEENAEKAIYKAAAIFCGRLLVQSIEW